MNNILKLSVSAAALSLLLAGGVSSARAADVVPPTPGCGINGSVTAGYMYNWQDISTDFDITGTEVDNKDFGFDEHQNWQTPFAEGAALVTCGGLNIQGDFAWYQHNTDLSLNFEEKDDDFDISQTNMHAGGAVFFRDPDSWAGGISASKITQKLSVDSSEGNLSDIWRIGLFGELYLGDVTLGASGHYYDKDYSNESGLGEKDEDGFELAAWGRFYPTPDLSLMVRGDLLLPNSNINVGEPFPDFDYDIEDGWAVTGEAEYLAWDRGLTLFAGARYAERSLNFKEDAQPFFGADVDSDVEDLQVYAGLKFYFDFGGGRTLIENHRTGAFDNTSVFHEKLPELNVSSEFGAVKGLDNIEP